MSKDKKQQFRSLLALFLVLAMSISVSSVQIFAEETIIHGDWKITNTDSSGVAKLEDLGFTYKSPTTKLDYGTSGGKNYVKSANTNGSASNGIVVTENKSYCDFTSESDGTLTVYVGNAPTKTGYVSKKDADGKDTTIGSFVPGVEGDFNTTDFKVTQGTTWATLDIETEKGSTYYITVSGSKMFCYGAEFVPYTNLSGTIGNNFELNGYGVKLVNKETGQSVNADVMNNAYSATVKPGSYSVALTGESAANYAFSSETRLVTVEASETLEPKAQTHNLTIEESTSYQLSGNLVGVESIPSDIKLIFVPNDTASHENVAAEISDGTYSARLVAGETYTLNLEGAKDYELAETVTISNEDGNAVSKNVTFKAAAKYDVTGNFIVLGEKRGKYKKADVTPSEVKFTNVDDNYEYTGSASDGTYTTALRAGVYQASITADGYSTSTHITVGNAAVTRDILLKDTSAKTVSYSETIYVGDDKEYKTVQAAVDAAAAMKRENGERVVIKISPGTYCEQVVVNTPNITFESDGGNRNNTKITWYYGIGYKYYSCVNSVYDPYADYDKYEKGNAVSYWGSAVITQSAATGFRADGITFENSFNKYITSEEIEDGAEPNGLQSINVARKENTNADTKAATERAAALVNYADKTEFRNCAFIGSQDTLYTCNNTFDSYYKNCYIEGQTDFIYGNGDVIFDGCEINFCGYDGTPSAGYITANSCSAKYMAEDGYIFRNCYISYNSERDVTAGYLGRMWGDSAKVAFINTKLQQSDMIIAEGWQEMGSNPVVKPTDQSVTIVEYNTTCNGEKADTSKRAAGVKDTLEESKYSVGSVFIEKGWTPAYYSAEKDTTPEFKVDPAFVSNGDLNTPNPGETVTVAYELGDDWAENDASIIDWYAVAENFDATNLETILESATLLKTTSAISTNRFQIPMECAGKFLMAVVTPVTLNNLSGNPKYIIDTQKTVSSNWSDPDNEGSIAPGSGINIYLAGDSTVKDYSAAGIYNGGKILSAGSWGEFLNAFFDERYVTVNNYAQGGRSLRSFLNEGKLDTIIQNIKAGDYLFIQFGHNDCANGQDFYQERFAPLYTKDNPSTSKSEGFPTIKPTENMKSETPSALASQYGATYYSWDCGATYKGYIQYYIDATLSKGAVPVVVSPVSRLYYSSGKIKTHHDATVTDYEATKDYLTENDAYVTACKEIYEENKDKGVLYIDAFNMTKTMYEDAYTACDSDANGVAVMDINDKTHSNKTGGVIQAGLIAKFIKDSAISISPYVVQPTRVYGEETSGEYIFTIDKDGIFTAKDKSLNENSYWTKMGQNLFDSVGGKEAVPSKVLSLDFKDEAVMNLYESEDTYTEGIYSGEYTNTDGNVFDVSIMKSGIQYYNHQANTGTKATAKKPIFSITLPDKGMYTFAVTAGTGSGIVTLYKDLGCNESVVSNDAPGNIVYKKKDDAQETLYFAASESNNLYISEVSITKAELGEETKIKFSGNVTGIETDDTDVEITLKGSTETVKVSADDYQTNGTELIAGENYEVSAKGNKGVYKGTSVVTDESGAADIVLSRIAFDFPMNFVDNYNDYKIYFDAKGYGSGDITDEYSGITAYRSGIVQTDDYKQYGVKTNAEDIVSFNAKQTGTITVDIDVSVTGNDRILLKVNDNYAPNLVSAVQGKKTSLSVMVKKGDKITITKSAKGSSNLWYKSIDVNYAPAAFLTGGVVINGNEAMIYGLVDEDAISDIDEIGFYYSKNISSGFDGYDAADVSDKVYPAVSYNNNEYSEDGKKIFATVLTDLDKVDTVYVYTFAKSADGKVYSTYTKVK